MRVLLPLILLLCWPSGPVAAQPAPAVEVDTELLLMVDVSRSMRPFELEIQRRGYAEALLSDPVLTAIGAGLLGRVALAYVEWAGGGRQRVVVDWMVIEGAEQARVFVDRLAASFSEGMRRTSISGALAYGADQLETNGFAGLRRVIDISGDGPNNDGPEVTGARDRVLARGIVINGLPLMTRDGDESPWHLEDLDRYYVNCVIGGPGAFAIPVTRWQEFAEAVRRKLVLELVGPPALPPTRAANRGARPGGGYDCRIGEKLWERNRRVWDMP